MFNNSKYGKVLTIVMVIVVIIIIGLIGFLIFDMFNKQSSDKKTEQAYEDFQSQVNGNTTTTNNTSEDVIDNPFDIGSNSNTTTIIPSDNVIKKQKFQGYDVEGTIEIPKTSVKLPILTELDGKSIDVSVCMMYGKLNAIGNATITGHNYRDGRFFANNKKLQNNDKIIITDYTGQKITYVIYDIFERPQNDSSFDSRDTNGKREITLSTCTDLDQTRRTIILAREE